MNRIKVTPEQLLHVSKQIEQGRQQLEGIRNNLVARIGVIRSQWTGVTQERFFYDFEHSRFVLDRALECMLNSSQDLMTIAERFEQADQEQVSLGAVTGKIASNIMAYHAVGDTVDKQKMVYNPLLRVYVPASEAENGMTGQKEFTEYWNNGGTYKEMRGGPQQPESTGRDIYDEQISSFKEGIHPATGESVPAWQAAVSIGSLQLGKVAIAFTGMYNRGYKVPNDGLRLSKSSPATSGIASSVEKSLEIQRLKDSLRYRILGYNHEQKKFSYNETLGISRSEKALNKKFQPSNTEGVDFKDPGGLGNISLKGPFLNARQEPLNLAQQNAVIENLKKHIKHNTAVDVHIVDTLGLNKDVVKGLKNGLKDSKIKIIFLE
ncbi:WXG100 family type VII secretion target [Paenibacillus illinoisensis]|uniref:WXG100 family type VII secretion target n=1 Tax=Paenibacillus illinoisensis TaxID=59845 RepID=A0ABW8HTR3_9BACL